MVFPTHAISTVKMWSHAIFHGVNITCSATPLVMVTVVLSNEPAPGGISSVASDEKPLITLLVTGSLRSISIVIGVQPTFGVAERVM
jgi:hypothetical protein